MCFRYLNVSSSFYEWCGANARHFNGGIQPVLIDKYIYVDIICIFRNDQTFLDACQFIAGVVTMLKDDVLNEDVSGSEEIAPKWVLEVTEDGSTILKPVSWGIGNGTPHVNGVRWYSFSQYCSQQGVTNTVPLPAAHQLTSIQEEAYSEYVIEVCSRDEWLVLPIPPEFGFTQEQMELLRRALVALASMYGLAEFRDFYQPAAVSFCLSDIHPLDEFDVRKISVILGCDITSLAVTAPANELAGV